ncbi:MAG: metallopeptidase TldD-related protein [Acidobacteriota bacterium]
MSPDTPAPLDALARQLARSPLPGALDLYLERVADCWWQVNRGVVVARRTLLREGAAVRGVDWLRSADGLDRATLAGLLEVAPRTQPAVALPPSPAAPEPTGFLHLLADLTGEVHWRGSWSAVILPGAVRLPGRPQLLSVTRNDGQRELTSWPPPPGWRLAGPAPPPEARARAGRATVLLAPPAAAVLLHELLGHPLEADLLLRGASPWAGKLGQRLLRLALDLDDDPTRPHLPGSFTTDDEGTPARPRPLLRKGVLVGALADRTTAMALGVPPGNARRASLHASPRPRMSNLIARAPEKGAELPRHEARIEVASLAYGALEPRLGLVILGAREAYALRRGERQRALGPFTLLGRITDLQEGLLAGGRTDGGGGPGWCAKDGEMVPTGAAVPWLLVSGLEVR